MTARKKKRPTDEAAAARNPARRVKPAAIVRLSLEAALAKKVAEIRDDREQARKDQGWTAVAVMHRMEVELLKQLDEERRARAAEEDDPIEDVPDEDLIAQLVAAIEALPQDLLDPIADAIAARRPAGA